MVAMTERTCVNRAIRSYVYRRKEVAPVGEVTETEQEVYRRMYLELKYRYRYDVRARLKKSSLKSKIEQIEADGQMCNLLAICHHLLS